LQNAINETNMNKINGSANIKQSAENAATAHTLNRCRAFEETEKVIQN
jgi:hypothetical protein